MPQDSPTDEDDHLASCTSTSTSSSSSSSASSSSSNSSATSSRSGSHAASQRGAPRSAPAPTAPKTTRRRHTVRLVCPYCQKLFTGDASVSGVRSNYRRHLRTHTKERPFTCPICADTFTTSSNRKRHVGLRHPELASPSLRPRRTTGHASAALRPTKSSAAAAPPLPVLHRRGGTLSSPTLAATMATAAAKASPGGRQRQAPPPLSLPHATDTEHVLADHVTDDAHAARRASVRAVQTGGGSSLSPPSMAYDDAAAERCRYCGKSFAWQATCALHEQQCRGVSGGSSRDRRARSVDVMDAHATTAKATVPPPVFTCEYCELELSSRTRLRRHMRYYCPFRDDVFADPFEDAVERRASLTSTPALTSSGAAGHAKTARKDDADDSADERNAALTMSHRTGLKFYEDANRSDGEASELLEEEHGGEDEGTRGADGSHVIRTPRRHRSTRAHLPPNDTLLWLFGFTDDDDDSDGEKEPLGAKAKETDDADTQAPMATPAVRTPQFAVVSSATASDGSDSTCSSPPLAPPHAPHRQSRRLDSRGARSSSAHRAHDDDTSFGSSHASPPSSARSDESQGSDASEWPHEVPQLDFKRRAARGSRKRARRIYLKRLRQREWPHDDTTAPTSPLPSSQDHTETSGDAS